MIYFYCPAKKTPTGGVRKIYRFVEILVDAGLDAVVVHPQARFRYAWANSSAPVWPEPEVSIRSGDILVVPEYDVLDVWPEGVNKIILNQNPFLTYRDSVDPSIYEAVISRYHDEEVLGIITVSAPSELILTRTCPDIPVRRIHLGIDSKLYFPSGNPERIIAFMPRRRRREISFILGTLVAKGTLTGWTLASMDDVPEEEVAATLRRAAIFLCFSQTEGFGLPAAEAMASGCLVIGYDGYGGSELFRSAHSIAVPEGDPWSFISTVEGVTSSWGDPQERDKWLAMGVSAAQHISSRFSLEAEREDVLAAFAELGQVKPSLAGRNGSGAVVWSGSLVPDMARRSSRMRRAGYHAREALRTLAFDD